MGNVSIGKKAEVLIDNNNDTFIEKLTDTGVL